MKMFISLIALSMFAVSCGEVQNENKRSLGQDATVSSRALEVVADITKEEEAHMDEEFGVATKKVAAAARVNSEKQKLLYRCASISNLMVANEKKFKIGCAYKPNGDLKVKKGVSTPQKISQCKRQVGYNLRKINSYDGSKCSSLKKNKSLSKAEKSRATQIDKKVNKLIGTFNLGFGVIIGPGVAFDD